MTPDDLDHYLKEIGLTVETLTGADNNQYTTVRDFTIPKGALAGKICDIAIPRPAGEPYVLPAVLHIRPALLPMDSSPPHATQSSGLEPEWQYWSRRLDRVPTPKNIWTHIVTVLGEK